MGEEQSQLAILDAGAIYLRAIYRRCAEAGVKPTILPLDATDEQLTPFKSLIVSGSGHSVNGEIPDYNPKIFDGTRPVLGLCFGMQLMNHALGGTVVAAKGGQKEYGQTHINVNPKSRIFNGLDSDQRVLMSHGDSIDKLADGFLGEGWSNGLLAAIENPAKRMYGVQFHPEMIPITKHGKEIFDNFLYEISGLSRGERVTPDHLLADAVKYVRENVGDDERVFMLLSGGVDSTVALKIVTEAIGPDRVHGCIMDTGFMRKGEPDEVFNYLYKLSHNVELDNVGFKFLNAEGEVKGTNYRMSEATNSEVKRALFRGVYKQIADDFLKKHHADPDKDWILQGTLATDIAESGLKRKLIKTHHNVGLGFKKELTPLQYMHKDEVRAVARTLGLPDHIARRQPFPGPGLLVRIPCADQPNIDADYQESQAKVKEIAKGQGLEGMLLPIVTVGIQGDQRTYTHPVLLWGRRDWDAIDYVADIIPRQVHNVNRVEYLLNTETPITEDPEKLITQTRITPETVALLQEADHVMNGLQSSYGLDKRITQMPGCMLPVSLGKPGSRIFSMRPMFTPDFYAGVPGRIAKHESEIPHDERDEFIPESFLDDVQSKVSRIPGLYWVSICRSAKPPTTTEPE